MVVIVPPNLENTLKISLKKFAILPITFCTGSKASIAFTNPEIFLITSAITAAIFWFVWINGVFAFTHPAAFEIYVAILSMTLVKSVPNNPSKEFSIFKPLFKDMVHFVFNIRNSEYIPSAILLKTETLSPLFNSSRASTIVPIAFAIPDACSSVSPSVPNSSLKISFTVFTNSEFAISSKSLAILSVRDSIPVTRKLIPFWINLLLNKKSRSFTAASPIAAVKSNTFK